ncbi:MAG: VCBS repeat-containing protein [Deltaproteobacteria bacterium]|nr:VCBS repeat-containing protein [Deltaproteobacteria bacterium]
MVAHVVAHAVAHVVAHVAAHVYSINIGAHITRSRMQPSDQTRLRPANDHVGGSAPGDANGGALTSSHHPHAEVRTLRYRASLGVFAMHEQKRNLTTTSPFPAVLFAALLVGVTAIGLSACGGGTSQSCRSPSDCPAGYECIRDSVTSAGSCEACPDEVPYDGLDNDCDPASRDRDLDGDGDNWVGASVGPGGDCNDNDATINSQTVEVCGDGIDNDCDDRIDEAPCGDETSPTVAFVHPVDNDAVRGTVSVELNVQDDGEIALVEIYAGPTLVGTKTAEPWTIPIDTTTLSDGPVVLRARATDKADRIGQATISIRIDNTEAPTLSLPTFTPDASFGGNLVLDVDANDSSGIATLTVEIDGQVVAERTGVTGSTELTIDTRGLADGDHTLTIRATDGAGNVTTSSHPLHVDNTGPEIATTPGDGASVFDLVEFVVDAQDPSGVASTSGGGTTSPGSHHAFTIDTSQHFPGALAVTVSATDNAIVDGVAGSGNVTERTVSLQVQEVGPFVSFVAPATGKSYGGHVTIEATVFDVHGVGDVAFILGGVLRQTFTAPPYTLQVDTTAFSDGPVVLEVTTSDRQGHARTVATDLVVDNTAPVLSFDPSAGSTIAGIQTITISATDASGIASIEHGTDESIGSPLTFDLDANALPSGPYTISATAHDLAIVDDGASPGNTATAHHNVVIESDGPEVAFTAPADITQSYGGDLFVTMTATDPNAVDRVSIAVDGLVLRTMTAPPFEAHIDTTAFTDGPHVVEAIALDGLGNRSNTPYTVSFDNTGPTITFTSPSSGATISGQSETVTLTATDPAGVRRIASQGHSSTTSQLTYTLDTLALPNGALALTATARDQAIIDGQSGVGNESTGTLDVTVFNAINEPPTVTWVNPLAGDGVFRTIDMEVTATAPAGIDGVDFLVNGITVSTDTRAPYTFTYDYFDLAGTVSLEAIATTPAGITGSSAITITAVTPPPIRSSNLYTVAGYGEGYDVGDVTGDGVPDLVLSGSKVAVRAGLPRGGYAAASTFGSSSVDVTLADLDQDQDLDIFAISSSELAWYINDGQGNFNPPQILSLSNVGAKVLRAIDLNDDGWVDVVISRAQAGGDFVVVHQDPTTHEFTIVATPGVNGSTLDLEVADVDGDDHPDVLVTRSGSTVFSVFRNADGLGTFGGAGQPTDIGSLSYGLAVGDMNGDHYADIVTTGFARDEIRVLLGDPTAPGQYTSYVPYAADTDPRDVTLGDLDHDGDLDAIVLLDGVNGIRVFTNDGAGALSPTTPYSRYTVAKNPDRAKVVDLNEDGLPEVLMASDSSNGVAVIDNLGEGRLNASPTFDLDVEPNTLAAANLTGSGLVDIAFGVNKAGAIPANVRIAESNGQRLSVVSTTYLSPNISNITGLATGQLDGQHGLDVAVATGQSMTITNTACTTDTTCASGYRCASNRCTTITAELLMSNGDDTYAATHLSIPTPKDVDVGDVLGTDGRDEAVFTVDNPGSTANDGAVVYSALGERLFEYALNQGAEGVVIANLDGDAQNQLDFAIANSTSDNITLCRSLGTTFATPQTFDTRADVKQLTIGLVAGDRRTDLIGLGTAGIILMEGDPSFTFRNPTTWSAGTGPTRIVTADLNADGIDDVVSLNASNQALAVMLGRPQGGFFAPEFYPLPVSATDLVAADVSGNGDLDVVVANRSVPGLTVLFADPDDFRVGPVMSLIRPDPAGYYGGSTTLEVSATDDDGVDRVSFYVDGQRVGVATSSPYAVTIATSGYADGAHLLQVVGRDGFGNEREIRSSLVVDNTGPELLVLPGAGTTLVGPETITVSASDPAGLAELVSLGHTSVVSPLVYELDTNLLPTGSFTIDATATDAAIVNDTVGHGNTTTRNIPVLVENPGPTLSFVNPTPTQAYGGGLTALVDASDPNGVAQVRFLVDNVALTSALIAPYEAVIDASSLSDGPHTLTAIGEDALGNEATESIEFLVDNTGPILSFSAPGALDTLGGTVQVTISASDAAGVRSIESEGRTTSSSPLSYALNTVLFENGPYTLTASAHDATVVDDVANSGNEASVALPVTIFNGVNEPPTVAWQTPLEGDGVYRTIDMRVAATAPGGIARVDFAVGGVLVGSDASSPYQLSYAYFDLPDEVELTATAYTPNDISTVSSIRVKVVPEPELDVPELFSVSGFGAGYDVGDVTGDGIPDLILSGTKTSIRPGLGQGRFGVDTFLTGAATSVDVKVADLDHDGALDILTLSSTQLSVFINQGAGSGFAPPENVALGSVSGKILRVGDLNGDGFLDVVIGQGSTADFSVLHQDPTTTTFSIIGTTPRGAGSVLDLELADVDLDGHLDVVLTRSNTSSFYTYLNADGAGTFGGSGQPSTGGASNGSQTIAVASIDGDGYPDVVVSSQSSDAILVYLGNEAQPGQYAAPVSYAMALNPSDLATGDLDGDGDQDIVVTLDGTHGIRVLLNDGDGLLAAPTPHSRFTIARAPDRPTLIDLTGDGLPDLLVATDIDNGVAFAKNLGEGAFRAPPTDDLPHNPVAIAVGDMAGDGAVDVAYGVNAGGGNPARVVIAENDDRRLSVRSITPLSAGITNVTSLAVGRLDGNAGLDIAVGSDRALTAGTVACANDDACAAGLQCVDSLCRPITAELLLGDGSDTYTLEHISVARPRDVAIGNVWAANDFAEAIFTIDDGTNGGGASVFSSAGTELFTYATLLPASGIVIGNLDGDANGFTDFAVANSATNTNNISIFRSDGSTFLAPLTFDAQRSAKDLAMGITAGDSRPDLLAVGTNGVTLMTGDPVFTFSTPTLWTTGGTPTKIATQDLNADGLSDVIVLHASDDKLAILIARPQGGFFPASLYTLPDTPTDLAVGDLSGNGEADIVISNTAAPGLTVIHSVPADARVGPVLVLVAPDTSARYGGLATLEVSANDGDGVDRVEFIIDGQEAGVATSEPYATTIDTTLYIDGTHILEIVGVDGFGNKRTLSTSLAIDNTGPEISFAPPENTLLSGVETLAVSAVDPSGLLEISSESHTAAVSPLVYEIDTNTLTPGPRIFTATARDGAIIDDLPGFGNLAVVDTTYNIENPGPVITFLRPSPSPAAYYGGTMTAEVSAVDANGVSLVTFAVDGDVAASVATTPYSTVLDTTRLADGPHTLSATGVDALGHASVASMIFEVDNSGPIVSFTQPLLGATIAGVEPVTVEAIDAAQIRRVTSGAFSSDHSPLLYGLDTLPLPNGHYTIEASAIDGAIVNDDPNQGNARTVSIAVDVYNAINEPPTVAWQSPSDGDGVYRTIPMQVSATAPGQIARVEFYVNGTLVGTDSSAPYALDYEYFNLSGDIALEATAYNANNISTTAAITVSVVEEPPFQTSRLLAQSGFTGGYAVGDLDQDGLMDLVYAGSKTTVRYGVPGGGFESGVEIGPSSVDTTVVDLDGDGDLDVVAISTSALYWMMNIGERSVLPADSLSIGSVSAKIVRAGDVNGDGAPDLVISRSTAGGDFLVLHQSPGTDSFNLIGTRGLLGSVSDLKLADVDLDGHLDVVVVRQGSTNTNLTVFRNANGAGTFGGAGLDSSIGSQSLGLDVADLTGDGYPDVVVTALDSNLVRVFPGVRASPAQYTTSTPYPVLSSPRDVLATDIDEDGDRDLLVTLDDINGIRMLVNDGSGVFVSAEPYARYTIGRAVDRLALVDVTGDGEPDLVAASTVEGGLLVAERLEDGTFKAAPTIDLADRPSAIVLEDMTNDGVPDVVYATNKVGSTPAKVSIASNDGTLFTVSSATFVSSSITSITGISVGNLDGVHGPDIAVASDKALTVSTTACNFDSECTSGNQCVGGFCASITAELLLSDGAEGFDARHLSIQKPKQVAVGDVLNNDGIDESVFSVDNASGDDGTVVYDATGTRLFERTINVGAEGLVIANLDRDAAGRLDFAVANATTDNVTLFRSLGASFAPPETYNALSDVRLLAAGKVAGDNRTDLFGLGQSGLVLLPGDATFTFGTPTLWAAGSSPSGLVAADVNRDGLSDVLSLNASSDRLVVMIARPQGGFFPPHAFVLPADPSALDVADMSDNGEFDVVAVNTSVPGITVLYSVPESQRVGPAMALLRPSTDEAYGGRTTLEATAVDEDGVTRVEFFVDGTSVGVRTEEPYVLTIDTTPFSSGEHELLVVGTDGRGNARSLTSDFNIDNDGPVVSIVPAQGSVIAGTVDVSISATDVSGILSIESDAHVSGTSPLTYTIDTNTIPEGDFVISATAHDGAIIDDVAGTGNVTTRSVTVTSQNPGPAVEILSPTPSPAASYGGLVTIDTEVDDANGIQDVSFRIDSSAAIVVMTPPFQAVFDTTAFADGNHTVHVDATDLLGNVTTKSEVVRFDNTGPTIVFAQPSSNETLSGQYPVIVQASDAAGILGISSRGFSTSTSPLSYTLDTIYIPNGAATISADARDGAVIDDVIGSGNLASRDVHVQVFNAVNEAPVVTWLSPVTGDGVYRVMNMSVSATSPGGIARVEFSVGGQKVGEDTTSPYAFDYEYHGLSGTVALEATAYTPTDISGSASVNVTIVEPPDFRAPTTVDVSSFAGGYAVGDVDDDGRMDLVFSGSSVRIRRGLDGGGFGPAESFGSSVSDLVLVDLDGDLDLDIVGVSASTLYWYYNQGQGTYGTTASSISLGSVNATTLKVGDVSGDGRLDVVISHNATGGDFVLALGTPTGFVSQGSRGLVGRVSDLALADFDHDGDLDVAVARTGTDDVFTLYKNPGNGFFGDAGLDSDLDVERIAVGDLNGDTFPDFAFVGRDNVYEDQVVVSYGNALGTYTGNRVLDAPTSPTDIAIGDIDDDGDNDIIVTLSGTNGVRLYANDGTGVFTPSAPYPRYTMARGASNPTFVDVTRDGMPDLLVGSTTSKLIAIAENLGGGEFDAYPTTDIDERPNVLAVGDLVGDSHNDVAYGRGRLGTSDGVVIVAENSGSLLSTSRTSLLSSGLTNVTSLAIGDLDGTNRLDLAVGSDKSQKAEPDDCTSDDDCSANEVCIDFVCQAISGHLLVDNTADYSRFEIYLNKPKYVRIGDVIGDGRSEAVFAVARDGLASGVCPPGKECTKDGVTVISFSATSGGEEVTPFPSYGFEGARGLLLADLNEDGSSKLDIGVANEVSDNVSIYLAPALTNPLTYNALNDISLLSFGQVANRDGLGRKDLIGIGRSGIVLMEGDTTGFQTPTLWSAGTTPTGLATADLNGDGLSDVLSLNATIDSMVLMMGRPQGGFFPPQYFAMPSDPTEIAVADMSGEGTLDVVVSNTDVYGITVIYTHP